MSPKKAAPKKATKTSKKVFTDVELEAMQARKREMKAEARGARGKADGEADLLAKIAEMPQPDRGMATRVHALVKAAAPSLTSKTWYGMPAYANAAGKVVCFFQSAARFKARYATFGFSDEARLDDGGMWPTSFALASLSAADEKRLAALVKQAVG